MEDELHICAHEVANAEKLCRDAQALVDQAERQKEAAKRRHFAVDKELCLARAERSGQP